MMRNFILSFTATLLVMVIAPTNTKTITDSPIAVTKKDVLTAIEQPVYAQEEEVAQVPVEQPEPVITPTNGSWVDQCNVWAAQAGVTLTDSAIKLLERESHCNPSARNPSSSAGGIPQALPWTKMGCSLDEAGAPCQIKWFYDYAVGSYGSFDEALAHSYAVGWY